MKTILHNRISESTANVELAISKSVANPVAEYTVTYGLQVETFEYTIEGLEKAVSEYKACVYHAEECEGLHDDEQE